jgi:MFS transporter, putative metabolite:H+ symporter
MNILRKKSVQLVIVAAFGYFVDVYDLLLFSTIRTVSLQDIGVPNTSSLSVGLALLNWQMLGLLLGAICWGIFGDKKGRISVLFGSILIYSIANFLNSFVQTVDQYAILRFMAGFGLAGELGAGITLITEVMPIEKRGIGTTIIASFGLLGAAVASIVSSALGWKAAYIFGGSMGIGLLFLRYKVNESPMFKQLLDKSDLPRGDIFMFIKRPSRFLKLLQCVLIGLPVYFVVGLLITGAPEFGKELGISPLPEAGKAVMYAYIGMAIGDVFCGVLGQLLKSRKTPLLIFSILSGVMITLFLNSHGQSLSSFYGLCGLCGMGVGYWALINTNTAEQFGTNLRATVATLSPNLIRASLIPISTIFNSIKGEMGLIHSATIIGSICVIISIASVLLLKDTFNKDLDYNEE